MINEVIYKFTDTLVDTGTHIRCLSVINNDCTTGDPIYYDTDCWNDTLCGDEVKYCNPVVDGDLLYFQTRFPDNISSNPAFPNSGWNSSIYVKGEVYDGDGTLLFGNVTAVATEYMASYYKGSFQNIIVNTAAINSDCFYFAFYYKVDASTWSDPLYTEPFCKIKCNERTLLIETELRGFDCYNMFHGLKDGRELPYFGTSFFDHIVRLRIKGEILHEGSEIVKTEDFDKNITKTERQDIYILRSVLVPPYVAKKFTGQLLVGQTITVDGVEYVLRVPPTRNNEDNKMWLMDIELGRDCELDFIC